MPAPGRPRIGRAVVAVAAVTACLLVATTAAAPPVGAFRGGGPTAVVAAPSVSAVAPASSNASEGQRWLNLAASVGSGAPFLRTGASMAYDPVLNETILFGGEEDVSSPCCSVAAYGDIWAYSHGKWQDLYLTMLPPSGRWGALMAWDPADHYMLLYGGTSIIAKTGKVVELNDTWALVNDTWEQLHPRYSPPGTSAGAMAWDAADGYMVMYGGDNETQVGGGTQLYISDDTWSFVSGQWTNRTSTVSGTPPPDAFQSMAYDPVGAKIVMYGGSNDGGNLNETWTYSANAWKEVTVAGGPPELWGQAMASDPSLGGVIMFGGVWEESSPEYFETFVQTTWLFANGTWTNLTADFASAPPAGDGASLTYVANEGYLLIFGGSGRYATTNDSWALGPPVLGGFTANPSPTDQGVRTELNATPIASDGVVSYAYAGLPPGCTGANVSRLACVPQSTGTYAVTVSLSDSLGYTATHALTFVINAHPEVDAFSVTPSTITIGAHVAFDAAATGGTPTYQFQFANLPPGCYFRGVLNFSCAPSDPGVYNVTLSVSDRAGAVANATTELVVNPLTSVVEFSALPPTIDLGQPLNLSVTVAGGTAPFLYYYSGLPPNCLSFDTPHLSCLPGAAGTYNILVLVNDSFGSYANSATQVLIDPTPMLVSYQLGPPRLDLGTLVAVNVEVTGGTLPYAYAYSDLPAGCVGASTAAFTCQPTAAGNYSVEVTVTDGAGYVLQQTAPLAISPALTVLGLNGTPAPLDAGQTLTVTTDSSGGTAPLSFLYLGLPTGCGQETAATFRCLPAAGTFQATVTVQDALGATATITHTFVIAPALGLAPAGSASVAITLGRSGTLTVVPSGGSPPYTYDYAGLPAGCASVNASTLTCAPRTAGTFSVTVSVRDTAGENASAEVTLGVTAPTPLWLPVVLTGGVALAGVGALAFVLRRRRRRARRSGASADPDRDA